MCIIAVSEAPFSGGDVLATQLADAFAYRYIDYAVILEKAAAWGGDRQKMLAALADPLTFPAHMTQDACAHLVLLQAALADEVREGGVVCYGQIVYLLSVEAPHILRIRVESLHRSRLERIQQRLALNLTEAETHLRHCDHVQRQWTTCLYAAGLLAPLGYDLRFDLGTIDVQHACTLVRDFIREDPRHRPSPPARAKVESFAVTARVRAMPTASPVTSHLDAGGEVAGHASLLPFLLPASSSGQGTSTVPKPAAAQRFLIRIRPKWVIVPAAATAIMLLSLVVVRAGSWATQRWFQKSDVVQTFKGIITDSKCAGKHPEAPPSTECVRACVRQNEAKYAIWDGSHMYVLSDQEAGERLAAHAVVLSGSLDARKGIVHVNSVNAVPERPTL